MTKILTAPTVSPPALLVDLDRNPDALTLPPRALPRWNEPHHCGHFANHIHTWTESTKHGRAVWLVHECAVCGRTWDVLSDRSDEPVIVASVYPVWSVTSCGLCCAGSCLPDPDCCPCHVEPAPAVPA